MAGPRQSMPLGEYLLNQRLVTADHLEKALNAQVVYGGKLGTNLLEQGVLDLRTLAKALGKIHQCRALDPMQPIRIPDQVISLVPQRLARQHQAVPLAVEGRRLYIMVMDPTNRRALEGISLATGKEVVPVVLPEVRLRLLLERYYGLQQDLRYLTLARNLAANDGRIPPPSEARAEDEGDLMPEEVFEQQLTQMGGASAAGLQVVDRDRFAAEEEKAAEVLELADDDIIPIEEEGEEDWAVYMDRDAAGAELPVDSGFEAETGGVIPDDEIIEDEAEKERELQPADFQQATKLLEAAVDRDDIAEAVLRLAKNSFKRAVLFIVREGRVNGWDAFGEGTNVRLLRDLIISLRQPSVFKLVYDTKAHFLGAVPPGELNDAFLQLLGGDRPRSAFLYPILFRGKVVNLVYGDGGPGKNAPVDVSDLLIVGPRVPQTFERILQDRRRPLQVAVSKGKTG